MLGWMGRAALEMIGQGGLGYSLDPLVSDNVDEYGRALKSLSYVHPQPRRYSPPFSHGSRIGVAALRFLRLGFIDACSS